MAEWRFSRFASEREIRQPSMQDRHTDIAILLAELGDGGVGKGRIRLANEFARRGFKVDLLLGAFDGPYRDLVGEGVPVHALGTTHAVFGVPQLARYLRHYCPRVLLTQRIRVLVLAERARRWAGVPVQLMVTVNTQLSRHFESMPSAKVDSQTKRLQRYFPRADTVLAVSQGVAADTCGLLGWPSEAVPVVPNPAIHPGLRLRRTDRVDHPWLQGAGPPVLLAVGRLAPQKDFPTLLRAFSRLRGHREARLVILGEGDERAALVALAEALDIRQAVDLPGFVTDPHAWMARASLVVLSSAWEGFGNVLVEALALGTPVVATDCPSGPREILANGRYGPLVPVGDDAALAAAIERVLADPLPAHTLMAGAESYTVTASADRLLAHMPSLSLRR